MIRALGLREITESDIAVGDWFVHSGVTIYSGPEVRRLATIELTDGTKLRGEIRPNCYITATGRNNMDGHDDISLVVGRRSALETFDLVAAGYREVLHHLDSRAAHLDVTPGSSPDQIEYSPQIDNSITRIALNLDNSGSSISKDALVLALAAQDALSMFGRLVERNGAWRMLYDFSGKPSHETRHQQLFRLCAHVPFISLGIVSHPGADHGSGPTDLTLTRGDETHVIEFKKDTSKRELVHGLEVQLPRYMASAEALFGSYAIMCHKGTKDSALGLLAGIEPPGVVIDTLAIDCRVQISASKA
jgi:hypothetical protein